MKTHSREQDLPVDPATGRKIGQLIGAAHGAVRGFCVGIACYDKEDYGTPGIHEDQEGFYVLEGSGMARVGADEFRVGPGSAFIAARGVPHTMRRDRNSPPIKVLWCHGAV